MKTRMTLMLLAAACGVFTGCGGSPDGSTAGTLSVQLDEQNGSGQSGSATLTALDGDRTRIVLKLTNPPDVPQPAHVHSGSCDDLGDPVVSLTSVEGGRSETEVKMALESLAQAQLVIHAHKSEAEYEVSVACAPIQRSSASDG